MSRIYILTAAHLVMACIAFSQYLAADIPLAEAFFIFLMAPMLSVVYLAFCGVISFAGAIICLLLIFLLMGATL